MDLTSYLHACLYSHLLCKHCELWSATLSRRLVVSPPPLVVVSAAAAALCGGVMIRFLRRRRRVIDFVYKLRFCSRHLFHHASSIT